MKRGLKITMALILVLALLGGCAPKTKEEIKIKNSVETNEGDRIQTQQNTSKTYSATPTPIETWAPYEYESMVNTIEPAEGSERFFNNLPDVPEGESIYDTTYLDFAFDTFKACCSKDKDENVLISPASLLFATELAASGANGETLDEINSVLFQGLSNEEAASYATAYYDKLNELSEGKLMIANGAFINSKYGNAVYQDYLDFVQQGYGAQIQTIDESSESVDLINRWISWNTRDKIPQIVDEIDPSTVMLLVNALSFESGWDEVVGTVDWEFYNSKGEVDEITMISSDENVYSSTKKMEGFIKYYHGNKFAFVGILPYDNEISANEFMQDFTADDYREFMNNIEYEKFDLLLPEFSYEYSNENIAGIFDEMGMHKAFIQGEADFSNTGNIDSIFISSIVHKTFIEVNREGTKVSAVTVVHEETYSAPPSISLDRPFVYMIVDTETMTPLFIGTVNSIDYQFPG
ncbi:MAG: serpin family protein [Clostridiales bacterium]|nr:serpin family protein [Clostridiales bacterium]